MQFGCKVDVSVSKLSAFTFFISELQTEMVAIVAEKKIKIYNNSLKYILFFLININLLTVLKDISVSQTLTLF